MNLIMNLIRLFSARGKYHVIVLAEFSLKYAFWTWIRARLSRATHVVDGFVGLYESEVEDRRNVSPRSLTARKLKFIDSVALRTADVFLVDTDVRGDAHRSAACPRTDIVTLPVGAPNWAGPSGRDNHPPAQTRVLYYGNYIPLHGAQYVVDAVEQLPEGVDLVLTLLGDISQAPEVRSEVASSKHPHRYVVTPPVPEDELPGLIAKNDIVLGIFGDSTKASTVIANKVWQGLACGKTVITRESAALAELRDLVGGQLITVQPASARDIRDVLLSYSRIMIKPTYASDEKLEAYVRDRFDQFNSIVMKRIRDRYRDQS